MSFEVIVVGAGPAGASTALFLLAARPDLRGKVVLLEKGTFPRDKVCAGALAARADRILATIGVRVAVPSAPLDGVEVRLAGSAPTRSIGAIGRVVRRVDFDARLARIAEERGAVLVEDFRVDAVSADDDGVLVEGPSGSHRARALVGADGVGSRVRRSMGLGFGDLRAFVAEVDTPRRAGDPPIGVLSFDVSDRTLARGYAWDFPTPNGGQLGMTRGVYLLRGTGEGPADAAAALERRLERQGIAPDQVRMRRMAERPFEPHRPIAAPRRLLVGEAAGVDPFTGEGIAQAIEYGRLAGRYLASRLATDRLSFRDWGATVACSRLGLDLAARWAALPLMREPVRDLAERALAAVPELLDFTSAVFAGRRPPLLSIGSDVARRVVNALARGF